MTSGIGFYGKLPTQGDFVGRDLPADFTAAWDDWLQTGMAHSRELLGDEWVDLYMTMPPWRFVIAPEICGQKAVSGVLIPSVDRVGRYFPFTVALVSASFELPDQNEQRTHKVLEDLALRILDEDFSMEGFIEQIRTVDLSATNSQSLVNQKPILHSSLGGLCDSLLAFAAPRVTLFWTDGGDAMESCHLAFKGLPAQDMFAAMLDGNWQRVGVVRESS